MSWSSHRESALSASQFRMEIYLGNYLIVNSIRMRFFQMKIKYSLSLINYNEHTVIQLSLMQIDTLELPVDWQKVAVHRQANRIGKRLIHPDRLPEDVPGYGPVCEECGRRATHCPKFRFCQREKEMKERYGIYGPNCVIYLGFIKRIILFVLACVVAYSVPMLILNLLGYVCRDSTTACNSQDIIYFWSTYNVLGQTPGSLPHHIIWLVFSITMCLFALYLRKYSMQTYRTINNRNTTDSDFALLLHRLPPQTTEQDIKNLLEKQVVIEYEGQEDRNGKILEQMRGIKVRNVILVYRFYEMMETSDRNVKKFKKYVQDKQKGKNKEEVFEPEPFQEVTEFANAAIVRFNTNREKDLILKTVRTSCLAKVVMYFFPFYHPETQYQLHNQKISIAKAPEPTDIQWQNFGFTEISRIVRKILASLFTTTLLIFSAAISISVSIWIESLLSTTGIQPTYLTIILVIITLLINIIIQMIVSFCIRQIKLDTFTDENCEQLSVTVINESINLGFFSIFAPILAKLPSFIQLNTSSSSSFPLVMFTTIIIQSFLGTTIGFFLEYFAVVNRVLEFLHNRGILINTQTEAYNTFKGSQVPFVAAYAHMVKIIWFGFLYGVVSPICIAISLVGLILYYLYQRSLFNSKYSIPIYGGPRLNSTMVDLIDFTPFLVGLFNLFLYNTSQNQRGFDVDGRIYGVVITNIVIGAFHAVFPWKTVLTLFYNEKECTSIQEFDRGKLDKTYEKCYPAAKPEVQALMKHKQVLEDEEDQQKKKAKIEEFKNSIQVQEEGILTNCCCKF